MKFRVVVQTRITVFETIIEADHMARALKLSIRMRPSEDVIRFDSFLFGNLPTSTLKQPNARERLCIK